MCISFAKLLVVFVEIHFVTCNLHVYICVGVFFAVCVSALSILTAAFLNWLVA